MTATNRERRTQDLLDRSEWLITRRDRARRLMERWAQRATILAAEIDEIDAVLMERGIINIPRERVR